MTSRTGGHSETRANAMQPMISICVDVIVGGGNIVEASEGEREEEERRREERKKRDESAIDNDR